MPEVPFVRGLRARPQQRRDLIFLQKLGNRIAAIVNDNRNIEPVKNYLTAKAKPLP